MDPARRASNLSGLDSLLGTLEGRGVAAVLVTLPVTREYASAVSRTKREAMKRDLSGLALRHHTRYLDHFEDAGYVPEDFSNPDHLSPKGAEKFTRQLKAEFVDPFIHRKGGRPS
jgi:hypothetical protein